MTDFPRLEAHLTVSPLLEAHNLACHFPVRDGLFHKSLLRAVDGVDLSVSSGETLGIIGESGCGKTTLARLLLGLRQPTSGEVHFNGQPLRASDRAIRRNLQIVFQDPYSSLNPRMTAGEIVERPLVVHRLGSAKERRARVTELFRAVGLPADAAPRYPHEFSGGQRQRVAVARAIATNPQLVIADEPTSALDVSVQAKVLNLLKDLQASLGLTYIFISHDMRVVRHMCDRLAIMYLGKIVEQGPTEQVFNHPRHPYTRALLGAVPRMQPGRRRQRLVVEGEPPSPLQPPAGCHFHPRCPWVIDVCRSTAPLLRPVAPDHAAACHLAEALTSPGGPEEIPPGHHPDGGWPR